MRPPTGPAPRRISVEPERLPSWLARFEQRHGALQVQLTPADLVLAAADGAQAEIGLIWGPLPPTAEPLAALAAVMLAPRRLGALLVRKSAHAVGIFEGTTLTASAVGSHYVQGRTKAGGWSQQRYARRREHQADRAFAEAAEDAVRVLLPQVATLDGLVLGGDTAAIRSVLALPALAGLAALADRFGRRVVPTPDPKRAVLEGFPALFRAVPILLNARAQQ